LSDLYETLALLLAEGPEKDARSALGSMHSEIVHIHDFSDSTLLVVPDHLRADVEEGLGVREVECHEETMIMTTLVTKGWSRTKVLAQFRVVMSDLHKAGSLEAYALIRDFVRKEANEVKS
jgi:hypothetical protein